MSMVLFLSLLALIPAFWLGRRRLRQLRRRALRMAPFPDAWIEILLRNVPLYRRLPAALRQQLHGHVHVFLHEKTFEGCDGLVVGDEIRVTIAAQACLLLLNRAANYFPGFTTILVYPETFVVPTVESDGLVETHDDEIRLGESWHRGPVVLSWGDIMRDAGHSGDGVNVVLHEFAHKLDEENDVMDGLPVLQDDSQYASWAEVLSREYELLAQVVAHGEEAVLDEYAATSAAEFFAVATETFFDKPLQLRAAHPLLYAELQRFYRVDPGSWYEGADALRLR